MKTVSPSPAALAAREDLLACLQRHAAQMDALELLGVLSYTVGQCVAFQDQRTVIARPLGHTHDGVTGEGRHEGLALGIGHRRLDGDERL